MPDRSFFSRPVVLLFGLVGLTLQPLALADPPGFSQQTYTVSSDPVNLFGAAAAYSPSGALYVVQGNQNYGSPASEIDVLNPNGTLGAPIAVSGVPLGGFYAVAGAAWDPASGSLLVTDAAPGQGALYSINPTTGVATTLYSGDPTISGVAVRSNGDVFVSDASGGVAGSIDYFNPVSHSLVPLVTGLSYGSGIGFDSSGHLIYQQAVLNPSDPSTTIGEVYKATLSGSGASTIVGMPTLLSGNTAGYDLAVAPNGDVYVTGSGGLFHIDHATNAVSLFANDGLGSFQFATGLSLLSSTGQIAYIPEYNSSNVVVFTPIAVPEPGTLLMAILAMLGGMVAARRARRSGRLTSDSRGCMLARVCDRAHRPPAGLTVLAGAPCSGCQSNG